MRRTEPHHLWMRGRVSEQVPTARESLIAPSAGDYVTDGQKLYFVVGVSDSGLYDLEDASSGRVVSLMPRSLRSKKWRVVVPEAGESDGA